MTKEPILDVAQLAHVEIYSTDLEGSVKFFREILGMEEAHREGNSVYMRAYEDFYHSTLIITANDEAGLGHIAWRATSPQALERRAQAIEATGYGLGWIDGDIGHGRAYQFTLPDGHKMEILWDVEYYQAPEDQKTPLLNRPQKRPARGVPVRRIDHVNLTASETNKNVAFLEEALGFKVRERIMDGDDKDVAAWLSVTNLVHDIAVMGDPLGEKGRLHHICYWYGYPQHLSDVADLLIEAGFKIESGPGKHGVTQAAFLYVIEPGGNRVELFGDSGYQIFDPAWKTVEWKGVDLEHSVIWHGANLPAEFFEYATPVRTKAPVENA
ncbi:catechol 2,3-dioxygenase [Planococcus shenhongbingii]|uniref:Metapyrocatechase n=1 Tax=Planococcus shenhongbingii TaxID=3058398 RepID=A0ABT8NBF4_9BACL|nr:catechol 2,3-dioxygenase [Planococcus sp. N017]MDN7245220.1 catechol 2,3-dioxygenase [Planococcus sp. N017]